MEPIQHALVVLTDTRKVDDLLNPCLLEDSLGTNTRPLENAGRSEGTSGHDDKAVSTSDCHRTSGIREDSRVLNIFNTNSALVPG